jgi:hypothetical protein
MTAAGRGDLCEMTWLIAAPALVQLRGKASRSVIAAGMAPLTRPSLGGTVRGADGAALESAEWPACRPVVAVAADRLPASRA